jgi:nucleoside-diphosphate-sugar epimerase
METTLVTGSSGTIGTRLCERLLDAGSEVIGVDWVPNKWQARVQAVTLHADLRHAEETAALADKLKGKKIGCMVHLAANARVYELVENPERALDNMTSLFRSLELCRTLGIKRFVFASSREGYGNIKVDKYKEDMVRVENCESPYTASKVGGEALVHSYARCYGIDAVIVRFSNVYGMYDDSERVVPLFIRLAKQNKTLTVFGKDKCLDFTYIDDAVAGVKAILERFDAVKGETINLAYGEGTTIVKLAEDIRSLLKSSSDMKVTDSRTGEVTRYIADISKARKLLGYDPKTPFAEGVKKSVEWYAKNT